MSTNTFDLGGGGNSFAFDNVGDSVTGRIVLIEELQQTDMDTGQPAVWDNGQPKMMVRVELQTELRDPTDVSDDGKRSVYLKGSRKPESKSSMAAVLGAVQAATGGRSLQAGGTLTLTYSGDGQPSRKGYNPPKQYEAVYAAPSVDLGAGEPAAPAAAAGNPWAGAQAAPPQYAQPVQQAAPAPQPAAAPAPAAPAQMTPEQQAAWAQWQAQQAAQQSA